MNTFTLSKSKSEFKDDEQLVFGWAYVCKDKNGDRVLDWDNQMIEAEDLEPAVYDFNLNSRTSNIMHVDGTDCGTLVESIMFTKEKMSAMGIPEGSMPEGWWLSFKIKDKEVFNKIKDGTFKMFSIEGSGLVEEVETEETFIDYSKGGI